MRFYSQLEAPSPYWRPGITSPYPALGNLRRGRGRRMRRRSRLGQLVSGTVDPSIQPQFFPTVNSTPGFTQNDLNNFLLAVQTRYIPTQFITAISGCSISSQPLSQVPGSSAATITTSAGKEATSIGTTLITTGVGIIPGAIVAGAGAILDVIGSIFGAKAAKERTEDEVLCQQLNNFNQALAQIDAALENGSLTSAGAQQAYAYLVAQYNSAVQSAGIINTGAGQCDAGCVFQRMINGIIAQRNLDLQTNPPPADTGGVSTSGGVTTVGSVSLPTWAWLLGGVAALWLLTS